MRWMAYIWTAIVIAVPAVANDWKKYSYAADLFSVWFPAEPKVETEMYRTLDGRAVKAHVYSLTQGRNLFRVTVADLSGAPIVDTAVIDYAAETLTRGNEVKVDSPHHIGAIYGRQLSIARSDGSVSYATVFYRSRRLYQIEGIAPAADEGGRAQALRFQQSFDFQQSLDFTREDQSLSRAAMSG
jgi:hypothetical protein